MNCSVPLNSVIAWLLWALAVVCLAVNLVHPMSVVTAATVLFVGGAATIHVIGAVRSLEAREQEAFQLGRESVRSIR